MKNPADKSSPETEVTESAQRPARRSGRSLRRLHLLLLRGLWRLGLLLLVPLACYLTLGRLFMPLIALQVETVESRLSDVLGVTVSIGSLKGTWFRFSPSLEISGLGIHTGDGTELQSLGIEKAFMTLDVPASLRQRELVISRVNMAGLALELQQMEDGRWGLAGLGGDGEDYSRQLLQVLLDTRNIALSESSVVLHWLNGAPQSIGSVYLELQNDGSRHELELQFRFDGQASPTQILVNLDGDPRSEFSAQLHAAVPVLDLLPWLAPLDTGEWQLLQASAVGRIWLELEQSGLQQINAIVNGLTFHAHNPEAPADLLVDNGTFMLEAGPAFHSTAQVSPPDPYWNVRIANAAFDLQQSPWQLTDISLRIPQDPSATMSIGAEMLELPLLTQLLSVLVPRQSEVHEILDVLDPRGQLRNVHLDTARDGSFPSLFRLRANLEQGAVDAWGGAPAGSGLDAYLELDARSGFAEVDSSFATLHLPRLFSKPWEFERLNTRVDWNYGNGDLRVGSTAIDVANSGLQGKVQFELENTRDSDGGLRSQLALLVGMEHMNVSMGHLFLPELERQRETMEWLEASLLGGELHDSGFLLRMSTLADAPSGSATFATWYQIKDGILRYLPDWPAVEGIAGSVLVHDGQVDVQTTRATTAGVDLEPVMASLRPQAGGGSLLRVDGMASGSTAAGLDFLRNTPVRATTGAFMDDWQADGNVRAEIALEIPLGEASGEKMVTVDVHSTASELTLPAQALTLSDITGLVTYQSSSGLAATDLAATLFGRPLAVAIETETSQDGMRTTRISGVGSAEMLTLHDWEGQPDFVRKLLAFTSGELDFSAVLEVSGGSERRAAQSRLLLSSDLRGLDSALPVPLGKTAAERRELQLDLDFLPEELRLALRYDDLISGQLVLDDQGINRGQLYLGARNRDFTIRQTDTREPGLLVSGELDYFSFPDWKAVAEVLSQGESDSLPLAEYLRLVDIDLGALAFGEQAIEDINIQVEFLPEGLQVRGSSARMSGRFTRPDAGATPWKVELDYLRFPPRADPLPQAETEEEPVDLLADVDPSTLPAFDFTTAEISVGEDNLGTFSFQLRPNSGGATIADFRMQAADSSISDIAQLGGANIDWRYRQGKHASSFNGLFAAGNLAKVLPQWGQEGNVESNRARFSGTLQWEGSPLAFALKESSGQILMDIRSGRFVDIQSNSSRLVGALNFDSLVRRLQLDFSDLFQRGFAFDRISGDLNFDDGVVVPNGGLLIEGPSSRITINGEIDLSARTIAADMLVRIPLGQNISMLAGILGAWPIALSTYLASKIFQDQVADFATVIYRLEGPWDNPRAGFEAPSTAAEANTDTNGP